MSLSLRMDGDPATLEHDIDETRARVDEVLDALQYKLSARQLRAQARHFLQERSLRFARRVESNVRDNPWPVVIGVLVAVSCLTLVSLKARKAPRHRL